MHGIFQMKSISLSFIIFCNKESHYKTVPIIPQNAKKVNRIGIPSALIPVEFSWGIEKFTFS
jgi:hypothetical protein